jgi:ribonuclease HII
MLGETLPTMIVGVDDCGGGSLAGPITAAAVAAVAHMPRDSRGRLPTRLLNSWWPQVGGLQVMETKSAPARAHIKRVALAAPAALSEMGAAYGVGIVTPEERDLHGDRIATGMAMQRATAALRAEGVIWPPDLLVVDGDRGIPGVAVSQRCIPEADTISWHVALASCMAYYHRWQWIEQAVKHASWASGWRLTVHLGFATPDHVRSCEQAGMGYLTPIHVQRNVMSTMRRRAARRVARERR